MTAPYIPFNHEWSPKSMREKLCIQSTHIPATDDLLEERTRAAFAELIHILDIHRPLGNDGKHGATGGHDDLHTATLTNIGGNDMNVRKRTEEVLAEHGGTFIDQDGDQRCECGKWLETRRARIWPHHVAAMLDDAGVLAEESYGSVVADHPLGFLLD